jgi:ribosomal protein S20
MGKGHGQKKKINDLIAKGDIRGAKQVLATSQGRISRAAHSALTAHMQTKLRTRSKWMKDNKGKGAKGYAAAMKKRSEKISKATKAGVFKAKEARRQELRIANRRLRSGD